MGVERDQPNPLQRQPEPEDSRAGDSVVAADEQGQRMERRAELNGVTDRTRGLLDRKAVGLHVTAIRDPCGDQAAGLDVVAPDPPQRLAQQCRRPVASARSDGAGGQRRSKQSDCRARLDADKEVRKIGPDAHAFAVATAVA